MFLKSGDKWAFGFPNILFVTYMYMYIASEKVDSVGGLALCKRRYLVIVFGAITYCQFF